MESFVFYFIIIASELKLMAEKNHNVKRCDSFLFKKITYGDLRMICEGNHLPG